MAIPCNCCPLGDNTRCYDSGTTTVVTNTFNNSQIVATSPGATYSIPLTHDGVFATPVISGITSSPAGQSVTGSIIDYFYSVPRDNVTTVQLYNQGGGDQSDFDGLSNATIVTLFDADNNVLFTGPLNAGNGPAVFQTAVGNLDGVARLRLSNISKLNAGATVSPLWREINTLSLNPVIGLAVPVLCDGDIVWYDGVTGNVIPSPVFVDCPDFTLPPCDTGAPLANSQPWTIYDVEGGVPAAQGLYAEKIVNGVTITGRVIASNDPSNMFVAGVPAGAFDANALSVRNRVIPNSSVTIEFDSSIIQTNTTVRVIDVDNLAGGAEEVVRFLAPHNLNADVNTPITPGAGNPGGIIYQAGPQQWHAPEPDQGDRSSQLTWNNLSWGGGNPLTVTFLITGANNPASGRTSQFDFGGQIQSSQCICNDVTTFTETPTAGFTETWIAPAAAPFHTYCEPVSFWQGTYTSPGPTASVSFRAPEIGGDLVISPGSGWTPPYGGTIPAGYVGTRVQNGITITLRITTSNVSVVPVGNGRIGLFANSPTVRVEFSQPVTLTVVGGPDLGDGPNEGFTGVTAG